MFCKRRITVIIAVTALCAVMQPRQILQAFREETVLLPVKQGVLEGTWTWPDGNGPWPAALLIQGSGPLDRDGNGPGGAGAGEMALLARGLAEQGTAVLRFDKAGTGRSPVIRREEDLLWEDGTAYAILWTERMRQRKEVSAFFLIGHSEGALTALEAARRTDPDGVVLLASPGFPAGTVLCPPLRTAGFPGCTERRTEPCQNWNRAGLQRIQMNGSISFSGRLYSLF